MSLEYAIHELAKRYRVDLATLLEAWHERCAIMQYLGGNRRPDLDALHAIEREFKIGLHAPRPAQPAVTDAGPSAKAHKWAARRPRKRDEE